MKMEIIHDMEIPNYQHHECKKPPRIARGKLQCLSNHILAKKITGKQKGFMFREKDICSILDSLIAKNENIVFLHGLRGMGKSSLARHVQNFMADRKICTKGNVYISCLYEKDVYGLMNAV